MTVNLAPLPMRLAIVGSSAAAWGERNTINSLRAMTAVNVVIQIWKPTLIISGECPKGGVDEWAEELARDQEIPFKGYPPVTSNWAGYRARNIQIAEACDRLVAIRSVHSKTYGSGWTADYAETLGKPVDRIML